MNELKAFYQPRSVTEAIALLEEHGERARALAGGTALTQTRTSRVEVLVDLGRLGLDRIEEKNGELHVGAMVSCAELRRALAGKPGSAAMVAEAAASIGSRILQNQVTVGGNCVAVYAWSDLPVATWCASTRFVVQGRKPREIAADVFFAEHPSRLIGTGELLTEIVLPRPVAGSGAAYLKLGRNATDHALASAAAQVTLEKGRISAVRLAAGAVRGLPQLLAADALLGQPPEPARLEEAARQAAAGAKVTADYRGTVEYRRQLLFSLVADALAAAVSRAQAGGAA